ncbi:MAG: hypothetical protein AAFO91_00015 [Bacteroidota bacterium]
MLKAASNHRNASRRIRGKQKARFTRGAFNRLLSNFLVFLALGNRTHARSEILGGNEVLAAQIAPQIRRLVRSPVLGALTDLGFAGQLVGRQDQVRRTGCANCWELQGESTLLEILLILGTPCDFGVTLFVGA